MKVAWETYFLVVQIQKHIIVRTKIDTIVDNTDWANFDNEYLEISSISGAGIPELIKRIGKFLDEN